MEGGGSGGITGASMDCIFCEIVAGRSPASVVHDDDRYMAFMDIRPVTPGHLLAIPKRHATEVSDMSESERAGLFVLGTELAAALRTSGLRCEGVDFFLADGEAAGQEVFHAHLHVIPRYRGDGFHISAEGWSQIPERAELDANAEAIKNQLS